MTKEAYNKDYYKEHCEEIKQQKKQYYQQHKSQIKKKREEYYNANKVNCNVTSKEWYKKNVVRQKYRRLWLRFGITKEQYDKMLYTQNYKCKICSMPFGKTKGTRCCVDHNHSTGEVRALICSNCNVILGLSQDSSIILQLAAMYLDSYDK